MAEAVRSLLITATKASVPPEWAVLIWPMSRAPLRVDPARTTWPLTTEMPAISPLAWPRSREDSRVGDPVASIWNWRTTMRPFSIPAV
ncbi:hypothetical protein D3C80_1183110 [compost metagenome]